jgi:CO/xanthine dehydrogenase Mo-binding subunit
MLSMPEEQVRCIYIDGSGCYGRNGHEDAAGDAALLSRAVGRPVRVQWMRDDEHGWDPKGPPTLIDLDAALDAKGNLIAWSSAFFLPQGAATPVALVAATLASLPREMDIGPGGILNDTAIPYTVPNMRTVARRLETTPLRPAWIRAPGRMQNTFANESFLDELATAAGADPLDSGCATLRTREAPNFSSVSRRWQCGRERLRSCTIMALGSRQAGAWPSSNTSSCGRTWVSLRMSKSIEPPVKFASSGSSWCRTAAKLSIRTG